MANVKVQKPKRLGQTKVRVKPHSHQPSKAEIDKVVIIHKKDGTVPTPEELARAALRPMKVIEDSDA